MDANMPLFSVLTMIPNDKGFDLSSPEATASLLVTTIVPNFRKLDPALHLELKVKHAHLNRSKVESKFSVPGIQGGHQNAFYRSFGASQHLVCL